jgi:hypothetical protein
LIQTLTHLKEVDSVRTSNFSWNFSIEGFNGAGVGYGESAEELVGLEDLHVARDQVAQILADQVKLIYVGLAWPESFTLRRKIITSNFN